MRSLLTLSPCQFLFQVLPWVAVLLPEHLQSPYPWDEPRHQFPHPVQPAALQISHIDLWGRSTQKMHLLFPNRLHTLQTFGLFWGLQDLSSQEEIPRRGDLLQIRDRLNIPEPLLSILQTSLQLACPLTCLQHLRHSFRNRLPPVLHLRRFLSDGNLFLLSL